MERNILVVEDEKNILDIIKFNLEREKYKVITSLDGEDGLKKALEKDIDLVILDIMMPKLDGFLVCKKIREKKQIPIIILTARVEEADKILGLEIGADDYITKPFSMRELIARIKANLRRTENNNKENSEKFNFGNLEIDYKKYKIKKNKKVIDLTRREFELVKFLALKKGIIFSREVLLEKVWGYEYFGDARTVDVTVRRIRVKLEDNPEKPNYIITKRGVGYYFNDYNNKL